MKRPLLALVTVLLASSGVWALNAWLAGIRLGNDDRSPDLMHAVLDPYDAPLLRGYRQYRDAMISGDLDLLARLAHRDDTFLAYRSSLALARSTELPPAERLEFYLRASELRVPEPLAREENRKFFLELGATAEAAGRLPQAIEAYAQALPNDVAVTALGRLETNPYRLANHYFRARLYRKALDALGELAAPSIEGPAHRRLGEHALALDAYERWRREDPENLEARYGIAWSHFYLGNWNTALEMFQGLPGASSEYARALILRREGRLSEAVALLQQTGDGDWLWLASSWLEAANRYAEALPVYLQIASGDSVYADDSAYRAFVLAERLGDDQAREAARELVPAGSFFGLRLGDTPTLPNRNELTRLHLPVHDLASELARVGDMQAARGELVFALQKAEGEAEAVSIAETLQMMGEFRQSQRAAQRFVSAGSRELRTWRAAYPRAYQEHVLREAERRNLAPELVWAIMRQESAFYPRAVSVSNAAGLMQVIPSTWDWLAELQKEPPGDRFDPEANIRYGSYYLGWLTDYHDGDLELIVPSYNRGQGYIRRLFEGPVVGQNKDEFYREIDALETREYLQRVMVNYHTYRALYGNDGLAINPESVSDENDELN